MQPTKIVSIFWKFINIPWHFPIVSFQLPLVIHSRVFSRSPCSVKYPSLHLRYTTEPSSTFSDESIPFSGFISFSHLFANNGIINGNFSEFTSRVTYLIYPVNMPKVCPPTAIWSQIQGMHTANHRHGDWNRYSRDLLQAFQTSLSCRAPALVSKWVVRKMWEMRFFTFTKIWFKKM